MKTNGLKMKNTWIIILLTALTWFGCKKDDDNDTKTDNVEVVTFTVSSAVGESLEIGTDIEGDFQIDWGDGQLVDYEDGEMGAYDAIKGNNLKIVAKSTASVKGLWIGGLNSIDLSKAVELTELSLSWGQLTRLDISNNKKLKEIWIEGNHIIKDNMDKILNDLPSRAIEDNAFLYYKYVGDRFEENNEDPSAAAKTSAAQKNWVLKVSR